MSEAQQTRPVILITGVSGLIGSRLVEEFADEATIVGLDIQPPRVEVDQVDFVETDLTDDGAVNKSLRQVREKHGGRLASVIHLAAYYDFSGEPSPLYEKLTVEGTRRLLRGLRDFEQVEQFVFSSTLLVMEPSEEHRTLTEESPTRAEWDYPRSKLEAEKVIQAEHGAIPAAILRIAGVYDHECHSPPISQHIARIYEKQLESYVFPGDPDAGQAFIHLDDLARCFHRVYEHRGRLDRYEVFLIAEHDVVSYSELQELIGQMVHGEAWPTIRVPKIVAKAGAWVKDKLASDEDKPFIKPWMIDLADDHYAASIAHARQKLDWEPEHALRNTLPDMIAALKSNPRGWYEENGLEWPGEEPVSGEQ